MKQKLAPGIPVRKFVVYTIFVVWVAAQFTLPALQSDHLDAMMWRHHSLGWLQIVFGLASVPLLYSSLYLYERRMRPGYVVANVYIGLTIVSTLISAWLLSRSSHLVAEWYSESRMLRGFPISAEKAAAVTNSAFVVYAPIVVVAIFAVIAVLLYKRRHRYVYDFSLTDIIKN